MLQRDAPEGCSKGCSRVALEERVEVGQAGRVADGHAQHGERVGEEAVHLLSEKQGWRV